MLSTCSANAFVWLVGIEGRKTFQFAAAIAIGNWDNQRLAAAFADALA
jgi:hypothetical protein